MMIALDAGHGYKGTTPTGAHGCGLVEDDIALKLVHKVRWYLLQAGHKVVLTRPGAAFVTLETRGRIAKSNNCDAFVSIHINASADSNACGAEVLVAEHDTRGAVFADKLLDVLIKHGLKRRGVKWDCQGHYSRLRVLRDTYRSMPAALIEVGFITNPLDAAMLRDEKWLDSVAMGLADAIG